MFLSPPPSLSLSLLLPLSPSLLATAEPAELVVLRVLEVLEPGRLSLTLTRISRTHTHTLTLSFSLSLALSRSLLATAEPAEQVECARALSFSNTLTMFLSPSPSLSLSPSLNSLFQVALHLPSSLLATAEPAQLVVLRVLEVLEPRLATRQGDRKSVV